METKKNLETNVANETQIDAIELLNQLVSESRNILSSTARGANGMYRKELFSGLTNLEKKQQRSKIRRQVEKFLKTFVQFERDGKNKDGKDFSELRTTWKKFSEIVYTDANLLRSQNYESNQKALICRFLNAMQEK